MKPGFLSASLLLVACLPLTAQIPRPRHVLYVDGVHGSDSNNCKTRKAACKTIGHAISLASPDDAILVGPATYYENLTINFNLGIIGSDATTTIIDGERQNSVIAIPSDTTVVLAGLTIRNGEGQQGGSGGGIENGGRVTIYNSIITDNVSAYGEGESDGGGIYNWGTLTLDHSTVSQNQVTGDYYSYGGGIYNAGSLTINNSTVSDNSALTTDAYGAGIFNGGTLSVNRSTISGNGGGDGDYPEGAGIDNSAVASITNSTIYGNDGGEGGGLGNEYGGTATVSNSTISGNSAKYGGGGISNGVLVTIQNSILAGNIGGNCSGTITSMGYNLSSDNTCNLDGPGDLKNREPKLTPLQNNGGPTQTAGELPGSPTIDAGNPNGCTDGEGHLLTTDQRGAPRPGKNKQDKRCDMGAFEIQHD